MHFAAHTAHSLWTAIASGQYNTAMSGQLAALAGGAGKVILCGVVLMLAIGTLGLVVVLARRFFLLSGRQLRKPGFSVESLQAMLQSGQISQEEFSQLRRIALGLDSANEDHDNSTLSPPLWQDDVRHDGE